MLALLLILTMGIPFPFCLFRMKQFGISFKKMLLIYIVFSMVGLAGASIGAAAAGGAIAGRRLYGLMIFDTAALIIMSRFLHMEVCKLGDFIAVPIMAVCASAKIDCLMNNCCRGFLMCYQGTEAIYFPSAILEMVIWSIFVVLLLLIEKKGSAAGTLWPVSMIWFGTVRYLVDFLRGSEWEKKPFFFTMPGGQFWSLIALLIGVVFLYIVLKKKLGCSPSVAEFGKSILGMKVGFVDKTV